MHAVSAAATPAVAAFDFDGTLTRRDTLLPYLRRSLGWPRFLLALLQSAPWLAAYACRLISNHRAKTRLLQVSLGGIKTTQVAQWTDDFLTNYLPAQFQPEALARLHWHQQRGDWCVLVSASPGIYLHRVGQALGMHAVLCTELAVEGDTLTGGLLTRNCHGPEKVLRLQAWLAGPPVSANHALLHAYGDSPGDIPLLNLADYAHYQGQPWARKATVT